MNSVFTRAVKLFKHQQKTEMVLDGEWSFDIEIDGIRYTVEFSRPISIIRGFDTICTIYMCTDDTSDELCFSGRAYFNPKDEFDPMLGARISLGRAMNELIGVMSSAKMIPHQGPSAVRKLANMLTDLIYRYHFTSSENGK